jgi:hypothetical protein
MIINYNPRNVIYDHKVRYKLKCAFRSNYDRKTFIEQATYLARREYETPVSILGELIKNNNLCFLVLFLVTLQPMIIDINGHQV